MPDLATKNIFHFIVRLAGQQKGDYLPAKIHGIFGDLEEMAEDYLMDRIEKIIRLMKEEAEDAAGKGQLDRVGRLHNVMLKVNAEVGKTMEKWRGREALEKVEKEE